MISFYNGAVPRRLVRVEMLDYITETQDSKKEEHIFLVACKKKLQRSMQTRDINYVEYRFVYETALGRSGS